MRVFYARPLTSHDIALPSPGADCCYLMSHSPAVPEGDAAFFIQTTFRRDRARRDAREQKKRGDAATVIGSRATTFLARRSVEGARVHRVRQEAATRVQAHQRRHMVQGRLKKERERGPARDVVWATAEWDKTHDVTGILSTGGPPKPTPPVEARRVGGGFARRVKEAR